MAIGLGVSIVNGIIYDNRGDSLGWDYAAPSGEYRISRPIKENPSAMVVAWEHWQLRENWVPLALNTNGPVVNGLQTYVVDETELIDMGGGIVKWDRIYANIPSSHTEEISYPKTIKHLLTTWNGAALASAGIISRTKTIRCHCVYDYGFSVGALSDVPDVSMYTYNGIQYVWHMGGFPTASPADPNVNNEGFSFIAGDIVQYMGGIKCRKKIYGPV